MQGPWKLGDIAASSCRHCRKVVSARFEYRTIRLPRTRMRVRDVLVDVCTECDEVISIPRQSMAQLRAAGLPA